MALARGRDTAAPDNVSEQAIVGRGGERSRHNLHKPELLKSTDSPSSFKTTEYSIAPTSPARTCLFLQMIMELPASGTLAGDGREHSSVAAEYSSVTLGRERPDESESMVEFAPDREPSPLNAYEVTLGIGSIHLLSGNSLDEYASDGDIELYQNKGAAWTGELTSEGEQKRLSIPTKEEAEWKQTECIPGLPPLPEWKDCHDLGMLLSAQSGHDKRAARQRTPASQEKTDSRHHYDLEVGNREGHSAI